MDLGIAYYVVVLLIALAIAGWLYKDLREKAFAAHIGGLTLLVGWAIIPAILCS